MAKGLRGGKGGSGGGKININDVDKNSSLYKEMRKLEKLRTQAGKMRAGNQQAREQLAQKSKNSQIPKVDKNTRPATLEKYTREIISNHWQDIWKGISNPPKSKEEALRRHYALGKQSKTSSIKFVNKWRKYYNNK